MHVLYQLGLCSLIWWQIFLYFVYLNFNMFMYFVGVFICIGLVRWSCQRAEMKVSCWGISLLGNSWQDAKLGTKVEFEKQLTSVFVPLLYNTSEERTLKKLRQFCLWTKISYKIDCNLRLHPSSISFYWRWILTNLPLNYIFFLYLLCLENF